MPTVTKDGGGGYRPPTYDPRQQAIQNQREVSTYRPTPPAPPPIYSNPQGQYSRPTPPPVTRPGNVPSIGNNGQDIEAFLGGDSGYQQQLRQLGQALADFTADVTRRKGSLESEFGVSKKSMDDQRVMDLDMLEDDYGARGIIKSGLYGKAVNDYETEFTQRMADLQRRQTEAMGGLTQEQGKFTSQQELQKQAAREAAIRRRAETLGI